MRMDLQFGGGHARPQRYSRRFSASDAVIEYSELVARADTRVLYRYDYAPPVTRLQARLGSAIWAAASGGRDTALRGGRHWTALAEEAGRG